MLLKQWLKERIFDAWKAFISNQANEYNDSFNF